MMESKMEMLEPSVNMLWQNLVDLNTSLFKENEEKKQQLIEMKQKLLEVCTFLVLMEGKKSKLKKGAIIFFYIVQIVFQIKN